MCLGGASSSKPRMLIEINSFLNLSCLFARWENWRSQASLGLTLFFLSVSQTIYIFIFLFVCFSLLIYLPLFLDQCQSTSIRTPIFLYCIRVHIWNMFDPTLHEIAASIDWLNWFNHIWLQSIWSHLIATHCTRFSTRFFFKFFISWFRLLTRFPDLLFKK